MSETRLVIASAAKQSSLMRVNCGLLRRFAPRNDGEITSDAVGPAMTNEAVGNPAQRLVRDGNRIVT
jgi:hypothetical protein